MTYQTRVHVTAQVKCGQSSSCREDESCDNPSQSVKTWHPQWHTFGLFCGCGNRWCNRCLTVSAIVLASRLLMCSPLCSCCKHNDTTRPLSCINLNCQFGNKSINNLVNLLRCLSLLWDPGFRSHLYFLSNKGEFFGVVGGLGLTLCVPRYG